MGPDADNLEEDRSVLSLEEIFRKETSMAPRRILVAMFFAASLFAPLAASGQDLEQGFRNPPETAKPHIWWHWMNGNITKEGITADLEAMKRVGIGGVQLFNVSEGIPEGTVNYMSPEWRALVRHAAQEAGRLGLELCFHNCAGWSSSGGPWITPENAMQRVVTSETTAKGPSRFDAVLPLPETKRDFYRDIAVLAFPAPAGNLRIGNIEEKAGYNDKANYKLRPVPPPSGGPAAPEEVVRREGILDLTRKMAADGRLAWDVPEGDWTILRFGYTPTGKNNAPSPTSGRGIEVDKMSREAFDVHWTHGVEPVLKDAGDLLGKTLNNCLIDSYEVGHQNWTKRFAGEFERRRGYDPRPWLPVMTGRVVESVEISERFLWDLRRTVADLFAENYYDYFSELCRKAGLLSSIEPYYGPYECLRVGATADIPMGEFWVDGNETVTCKLAASTAHVYGRKLVGAEAFTAAPNRGRWLNHPFKIKAIGDAIWCQGVNRFILSSYAHQPWPDIRPGMTMGQWGTHFERTNTWWEPGSAWMKYIARSQFLLQQGGFAADICFFAGETTPSWPPNPDFKQKGYDYDACGPDALFHRMSVKDGRLVLPDGMSYRLLVLPDTPWMTPKLLRRIKDLVEAGATVVGPRPEKSPSLSGYPRCDDELKALADELWGPRDGRDAKENACGEGKVIWGRPVEEVLASLGLGPDVEFPSAPSKFPWIHRVVGDADVYFVSGRQGEFEGFFRVRGKRPELWHPESGRIEPAPMWREEGGRTVVSLRFDPSGSVFVIFRKPAGDADPVVSVRPDSPTAWNLSVDDAGRPMLKAWEGGTYELKTARGRTLRAEVGAVPAPVEIPGPWTIRFPPNLGAPEEIRLENLISWPMHSDPGVRYFSGTAAYTKEFEIPAAMIEAAQALDLDLGQVKVIAEAKLNGKDLGILWKPPFRADITGAAKAGANRLEVRVTNLWVNRLVGDEQLPPDVEWNGKVLRRWPDWLLKGAPRPVKERLTFTTWRHWDKDGELQASGLLGPVTVRAAKIVEAR